MDNGELALNFDDDDRRQDDDDDDEAQLAGSVATLLWRRVVGGRPSSAGEASEWWDRTVRQVVLLPRCGQPSPAQLLPPTPSRSADGASPFAVLLHSGQIYLFAPPSDDDDDDEADDLYNCQPLAPLPDKAEATHLFPLVLPALPGSQLHGAATCLLVVGTAAGHLHVVDMRCQQRAPLFSTQIQAPVPVLRVRQCGHESSLAALPGAADGFLLVLFADSLLLVLELDSLFLTLRIALSREAQPELTEQQQVKSWRWRVADQEHVADLLLIPAVRRSLAYIHLASDAALGPRSLFNDVDEEQQDRSDQLSEVEKQRGALTQFHSSSVAVEPTFRVSLPATSSSSSPPAGPDTFLVVGSNPMLGVLELDKRMAKPFFSAAITRVTQVATKLFAFARSWWSAPASSDDDNNNNNNNNNNNDDDNERAEPVPEAQLRFSLADSPRAIVAIVPAPCGRLVALTDSLGRVLVFDCHDALVVRVFKGYRAAQCTWLLHDCRLYLVVYAPRRAGLLEVWEMRHGPRTCALQLGASCHSLHADADGRPVLFDPLRVRPVSTLSLRRRSPCVQS